MADTMAGLIYTCNVDERDKITQANALNSPLLRLPAELRNQICKYALAGGVAFILPKKFKLKGNPRARFSKNAFGLRCVCRQLRAEARSIFYDSYTFDLTGFHKRCHRGAGLERELLDQLGSDQGERGLGYGEVGNGQRVAT